MCNHSTNIRCRTLQSTLWQRKLAYTCVLVSFRSHICQHKQLSGAFTDSFFDSTMLVTDIYKHKPMLALPQSTSQTYLKPLTMRMTAPYQKPQLMSTQLAQPDVHSQVLQAPSPSPSQLHHTVEQAHHQLSTTVRAAAAFAASPSATHRQLLSTTS